MKGNIKINRKTIIAVAIGAALVIGAVVGVILWAVQPKGMVVAVSTLPDSLNPVLEQNTSGLNASELVFDGLCNFEVDPQTKQLYTDLALAESIEQDPSDKKTYTVLLRDVTWHDDTPVTAEDVVYSFNAYTYEDNKSPKRDYLLSFIENVEAEDDKTVKIIFKNPIPEFRAYPVLTFKIIPSRYNGKTMDVDMRNGTNEREFATAPIGTGPFKLSSWEIGKWLTFKANGLYYKTIPQADSLVMKRIIDPIVRMNELRKGRVNLVLETNPMDHETVANMNKVDINSYMPYAYYAVAINTKVFSSNEGRQSMSQALDKINLVPRVTDNEDNVIINNGPFPSNIFYSNFPEYYSDPLPATLPYDIKKAKIKAKNGNISGQNAILIYPDSMGDFGKQMAEGLVKQLAEIGLNVEAKRTGDQVFNRMINKEQSYELALMYYDGFDNIYSSIGSLYRSNGESNITGLEDKSLNNLLSIWEKQVVMADWIDLTLQLDKKISELSPYVYLCSIKKDVYSRGITNVNIATDNPFLSVEDWKFSN